MGYGDDQTSMEVAELGQKVERNPPTWVQIFSNLSREEIAERYPTQHYLCEKSCWVCRKRERAIIFYQYGESNLRAILEEQSKRRKHEHPVEISILPAPAGSMFTDWHQVQY